MDVEQSQTKFSRGGLTAQRTRPFGRGCSESPNNPTASNAGPSPRSVMQPKSPLSAVAPWTSDNNTMQQGSVQRGRKHSFQDGVDARPSSPSIESGVLPEEKVFITHVESPVLFWAQIAEHETAKVIKKMNDSLQVYCRNKPLLQSIPFIGKVYGGIYPEDKLWYRCRVKQLTGDDKAQVHFVDYGNTEIISLRSIVFLSHEILSVVPFAQLYCLDGYQLANSDFHDQAVEKLNELAGGRIVTVLLKETKKAMDEPCAVELRADLEGGVINIAEEMWKQGLLASTQVITVSDNPPPLSPTPRKTSFNEVMSQEMEKLCKENESLRSVIQHYKANQKDAEMFRDLYSSQESKHKAEMSHAVSHKFVDLVKRSNDLHEMRDNNSLLGKTPDAISEAIALITTDKFDLESLSSLQKVKEVENKLLRVQDCICGLSNKDMLAELISQRDKARQELCDTINSFCSEVEQMPLKEREESLQLSLNQLQKQTTVCEDSSLGDCILEDVIKRYQAWQEKSNQESAEVREKVNQCTDNLVNGLALLQKALQPGGSKATGYLAAFGDFDQMILALSTAIAEEIDHLKISEEKEARQITAQVTNALIMLLEKEAVDLKELREYLMKKYKDLESDISQWLSNKPDVKGIMEKRKEIKSLRSRLRHRLADKKDLEEGEDSESVEELQEVEKDISEIYLQLHRRFAKEHELLAELASCASIHFPELPLLYPELGLADFMESNGLLKPGRQLEHYPNYDSVPAMSYDKYPVIMTEFAGRPCILKEYSLDQDFGESETLQSKAVKFSRLNSSFLVALEALFVKGNKAFVQMPLLMSAKQWISSHKPTSLEVTRVLKDILEGLQALHSVDMCHGCVHVQSALVEKVDGPWQYRGRLDFAAFNSQQCSKASDMKSFGELIAKLNFPNMDSSSQFLQLTEDGNLLAILGKLLDTDHLGRLTVSEALRQPYFSDSNLFS